MNETNPLAKNIAGEITIAEEPSSVIRKWREIFQTSQSELAKAMDISPSVISDYESGRRKSPGTQFIKNLIEALIKKDEERGGKTIRRFTIQTKSDAILGMREFAKPIDASKLANELYGDEAGTGEEMHVKAADDDTGTPATPTESGAAGCTAGTGSSPLSALLLSALALFALALPRRVRQ